MIRRINKFIALLIIVSLCLYVVFRNYTPLTIHFSSSSSMTLPTGIILVAVFFFGVIVASLVGIVFGIRTYIRERRYQSQQRQREAFFREFMEARSLNAMGDVTNAREKWEKILRREKDSSAGAIARVEYARLLAGSGDMKQALRILDEARSVLPENIEILSLAAKMNQDLGNKTAAIDNLALVMYHSPHTKAAEELRSLSEDTGRIEDALEYNRQVERLGGNAQSCIETEKRLRFKLLIKDSIGEDPDITHKKLLSLLKEHGESVEVLLKLAELSEADGRTEEAAQFFARAARASKSPRYWHEGVKFWLRHDNAQRALAAARAASSESSGEERIRANIDLIRLYLTLNMTEEARNVVEETAPLLRKEKPVSDELHFMLQVLKGICLARLHLYPEAEAVWEELGKYDAARHLALLS